MEARLEELGAALKKKGKQNEVKKKRLKSPITDYYPIITMTHYQRYRCLMSAGQIALKDYFTTTPEVEKNVSGRFPKSALV